MIGILCTSTEKSPEGILPANNSERLFVQISSVWAGQLSPSPTSVFSDQAAWWCFGAGIEHFGIPPQRDPLGILDTEQLELCPSCLGSGSLPASQWDLFRAVST